MFGFSPVRGLLRSGPGARRFFVACAQSSLGTGLSLVALPLLALDRYASPWAVAGVLAADFVPAMLFGALLGGLADRWSRRACVVVADVIRFAALAGIVAVHSLAATLVLALVVGTGTALFRPAALSGMGSLAGPDHEDAATALFGALTTFGRTAGALAAGAVMALTSPAGALLADAATFALSAVLLATVALGGGRAPRDGHRAPSPLRLRSVPPLLALAAVTSSVALAAAMSNVAEPAFVTKTLGAGATGFAFVIAVWGAGAALGSLLGSRSASMRTVRRRFRAGIALTGLGFAAAGLSHSLAPALVAFAVNGFGNGLLLVHERALIRAMVPAASAGRAFGAVDAAECWAFAISLIAGGALVAAAGPRTTIICAGIGTLVVALAAARLPEPSHSSREGWSGSRPAPMEAP